MGLWARIAIFVGAETILVVTPMMWPTIPKETGIAIYVLAIALLAYGAFEYWKFHNKTKLDPVEPTMSDYDFQQYMFYESEWGQKYWNNVHGFYEDIAGEIRAKAAMGTLRTWGRPLNEPAVLNDMAALVPIPKEEWVSRLRYSSGRLLTFNGTPYEDFRVCRKQVEAIWPKADSTDILAREQLSPDRAEEISKDHQT